MLTSMSTNSSAKMFVRAFSAPVYYRLQHSVCQQWSVDRAEAISTAMRVSVDCSDDERIRNYRLFVQSLVRFILLNSELQSDPSI